jgi:putative iron-dependent peroxidase
VGHPQAGLFREGVAHRHYLELTVDGAADIEAIRAAVAAARASAPPRDFDVFFAFGPALWSRLGGDAIEGLRDFPGYATPAGRAPSYAAPATQRDLWVLVQGPSAEGNLQVARGVLAALRAVAAVALEVTSLPTEGNRDLIGFVDGTGNPKSWPAKEAAALIPGGAGGTFVMTQKWIHQLERFEALELRVQEQVVGRTKHEDIELEGDAMPPDSHVSRTDLKDGGEAMKIYRRSAAYGTATEHGLYFVAFGCGIHRFDIQLRSMYGLTDDGLQDRILEFSTAVTGSFWYAPGRARLDALLVG